MHAASFVSRVPMRLDCPPQMAAAVQYVLEGEYESHHYGSGLDVLDIGANIGSFARWADMRWPESSIACYEPNPGTFAFLQRNVLRRPNIRLHNAAVYPGVGATAPSFSRYPGDGEAGLVTYATETFRSAATAETIEVKVTDPSTLPSAHIVKINVEGAEAAILKGLDLSRTELILIEFQNARNRDVICDVLKGRFKAVLDEASPWDPILDYVDYCEELKSDIYGRIFLSRCNLVRLTYDPPVGA